ncbi:MAG: 2-dehydropantoate 2-reductase [Chloroflexota bacterium]
MRYLVFGSGAVGGLMGARLALLGRPVVFLARPHTADILRQHGLRLDGEGPAAVLTNPVVIEDLHRLGQTGVQPDVVLLCVKAYDCAEAADLIAASMPGDVPVVCLLNGIGNEQVLASRLGSGRVIAAALTTAVSLPQPGIVRVERSRGLDLARGNPALPQLIADLTAAGFRTRLHEDAARLKWSKLMTNIVANATSAITGWMPGTVFAHPGLYRLEVEALREVVRVLRAMGQVPEDLVGVPVRWLSRALTLPPHWVQPLLAKSVAGGRGEKLPSFHRDIGRGRSEVGWLNGAVVEHGQNLGVPTPANSVLTDILLGLVQGRLNPIEYCGQPDRLLDAAVAAGVPGIRGYNAPSEMRRAHD